MDWNEIISKLNINLQTPIINTSVPVVNPNYFKPLENRNSLLWNMLKKYLGNVVSPEGLLYQQTNPSSTTSIPAISTTNQTDNTLNTLPDNELGRALGTVFSAGATSAGNTMFDNFLKGEALTKGVSLNALHSLAGAGVGIASNAIGSGITSLGGNSMLSRGIGQGVSTGLGIVGGLLTSNLLSGTKGLTFGGKGLFSDMSNMKGAINPYALGALVLGTGLGAAFGPSKEYGGTYGNITQTLDTTYDVLLTGANFIPGVGLGISGFMALNKGLSNIFGSTDGITRTDAILGSAFMPAPVKWLNMLGSSKTGTFNNLSWLNSERANSFMQNAFGNLNDKFDSAREKAGKTYGTFSQGAKRRALKEIDFANYAWDKIMAMTDLNELLNIRSLYMTSINNLRYTQMIQGGWNPLAIGKQGMKIFNNATNHNMGMRLLSAAALIDNKQMILSALGGTKLYKPNIFKVTDGTGATRYIYRETPDSEEITVHPQSTIFPDPAQWTFVDDNGRTYTPRISTPVPTAELNPDNRTGFERAVDNYIGEATSTVPKGYHTLPAIGAAAFGLASPALGEVALTSGFAAHGLTKALNGDIRGLEDAAMTALEIAPLGRAVSPVTKWASAGIENAIANKGFAVSTPYMGDYLANKGAGKFTAWVPFDRSWGRGFSWMSTGKPNLEGVSITGKPTHNGVPVEMITSKYPGEARKLYDVGILDAQNRGYQGLLVGDHLVSAPKSYRTYEHYYPGRIHLDDWGTWSNNNMLTGKPTGRQTAYSVDDFMRATSENPTERIVFNGAPRYRLEMPSTTGTSKVTTPQITTENAANITPEQWTAAQDAAIARGDMAVGAYPLLRRGFRWAFSKTGLLVKVPKNLNGFNFNDLPQERYIYNNKIEDFDIIAPKKEWILRGENELVPDYFMSPEELQRLINTGLSPEEASEIMDVRWLNSIEAYPGSLRRLPKNVYGDTQNIDGRAFVRYNNRKNTPASLNDAKTTLNTVFHELGGHGSSLNIGYGNLTIPLGMVDILTKIYKHNETLRPILKPFYLAVKDGNLEKAKKLFSTVLNDGILKGTNGEIDIKGLLDIIRYMEENLEYSARAIGSNMSNHYGMPNGWNELLLRKYFTMESVDNLLKNVWNYGVPLTVGGSTTATLYNQNK